MSWWRRGITAAAVLGAVVAVAPAAGAAPMPAAAPAAHQPIFSSTCSADFYEGDSRLGPADLPNIGSVGFELLGYHRTGDLSEQNFLSTYWNPTTSSWIYPPDNGYLVIAGKPIEYTQTLGAGTDIDRFGSEYGGFLAPAGSPYWTRSIPPASLDSTPAAGCNYHDYQVAKPFTVDAGPIAPWFGQPGLGLQYQLDGTLIPGAPASINVMWLVNNGYLTRLN
jgi:hypothetical protein